MVYLILAFCSSALVSIVMRLSEGRIRGRLGMLMANYVVCTLAAAWEAGFGTLLPRETGMPLTLALGCFNGFVYLAGFVLLQRNVSRSGVVLSSTFMKLGLLVTMVISMVFFGERPGPLQILGFVLAVAAILLIREKGEGRFDPRLLVLMLTGGLCDGMSKIFEEVGPAALSGQFLFYTFLTALVLCMVLAWVRDELPGAREWGFGLAIGVPNYFSCFYLLRSLATVPGVIAYPVYSVAGILLVTAAGVLLFRERLSGRQKLAMGIILAALVFLNL